VSDLFRPLPGTLASPSVLLDIEDNDDTDNRPTVQETLKILRIVKTSLQFKRH